MDSSRLEKIAQLYRLAALLYLQRALRRTPHSAQTTTNLVEEGLAMLSEIETCERPWPLFVIACEARTNTDRALVLDIFAKSQSMTNIRDLGAIRKMVEAAWVQDDLHEEQELDYVAKLNAVMSAHKILPTFI
jgi:hypothetical protein